MFSCYSLRFIHRPPLHIVIGSLDIFQPLPEYFCCIIHIVISGCPAWKKAQHISVIMSSKERGGKPKDPRLTERRMASSRHCVYENDSLMVQTRQWISEVRDVALNHLCVIRSLSRTWPIVESISGCTKIVYT